jgi:hypothetical protein
VKPITGKLMQRFLGATGFNRGFSHEFARITASLESVKNVKVVQWTPELEKAFIDVKQLFADDSSLRMIDWSELIYLTVDASLTGLGAWLGQMDDNNTLVPVICVSKKLGPTQQRWSATKRELYGLMWAMEKLRHYLLGRTFIARVDHRPLVAMMRNKLNVMMEGWIDTIMKFNFTTIYLPGSQNTLADALSRQYEVHGKKAKLQPTITSIKVDDSLQMEAERRGKQVPETLEQRKNIMQQVHALGHFSVETMFREIWRQGYWWPYIQRDLRQTINSCIDCL